MFKTVSKKGNSIIEISTAAYKHAVTDIAWTDTQIQKSLYNKLKRKFQ